AAARSVLLDRGPQTMAGVVPAVRVDRHESSHALPGEQFHGWPRLYPARAATRGRSGEKLFRHARDEWLRRPGHFCRRLCIVPLVRPLPLSAENFPPALNGNQNEFLKNFFKTGATCSFKFERVLVRVWSSAFRRFRNRVNAELRA